jgi:hypothetical protein
VILVHLHELLSNDPAEPLGHQRPCAPQRLLSLPFPTPTPL